MIDLKKYDTFFVDGEFCSDGASFIHQDVLPTSWRLRKATGDYKTGHLFGSGTMFDPSGCPLYQITSIIESYNIHAQDRDKLAFYVFEINGICYGVPALAEYVKFQKSVSRVYKDAELYAIYINNQFFLCIYSVRLNRLLSFHSICTSDDGSSLFTILENTIPAEELKEPYMYGIRCQGV